MNAKDLMIGDLVTFKDCIEDGNIIPIKIYALGFQDEDGENTALVEINNCGSCDVIDIDDEIVGIPLTPEILIKNGFNGEYRKTYQINNHEGYDIAYISYWKGRLTIRIKREIRNTHNATTMHIDCNYVHELQHIFRDAKIDKEIVL